MNEIKPINLCINGISKTLPLAFDESITMVELLYAIKEKINEIINSTNTLNDEMQNLYDYVNNYFENLDVQEEINNKLDEMATDGTLDEIINQEIFGQINSDISDIKDDILAINGKIGTLTDLDTVKKDNIVNAINSNNGNIINSLRYKYSDNYEYFTLPVNNSFFNQITIYKDKYKGNYKYTFNPEDYKNSGGNSIYVSPTTTESSGTQDGSIDHPYNNILKAWNVADTNDTIILMDGVFSRDRIGLSSSDYIDKSINIVTQNEKYKTILTDCDNLSWTQNESYSNVYQATRSNMSTVIDIRQKDKGIFLKLKVASSLEECSLTLNSYYYQSNIVYVNIGEVPSLDKIVCSLILGSARIKVKPDSANINIYLKDLCCINGGYGIFSFQNNSTYKPTVIANNCDFLFGNYDGQNAFTAQGTDSILYKCKASYGNRDGFNYHANSGVKCNSIELDCIASGNGLSDSNNNNNGSTTHDGNSILRINGVYFNNKGGNVTDVQTDTKSINIQCIAFDSKSTGTTSKGDFINQQAGCDMWLYNCYSKGSSSYVNIYGVADTNIYVDNCIYDTAESEGNLQIN